MHKQQAEIMEVSAHELTNLLIVDTNPCTITTFILFFYYYNNDTL